MSYTTAICIAKILDDAWERAGAPDGLEETCERLGFDSDTVKAMMRFASPGLFDPIIPAAHVQAWARFNLSLGIMLGEKLAATKT